MRQDGDFDPQFVDITDWDGVDNMLSTQVDGLSLQSGSPAINGIANYFNSSAYLSDCTFTIPTTEVGILNESGSTVTISGTVTTEKEE